MGQFMVRQAQVDDAHTMAELFAAVAEERDGVATEPPVDIGERAALFARSAGTSLVAVADGRIVGTLHVEVSRHGFGDIGMCVERSWRGRGVGSEPQVHQDPRNTP
jgi:GNAT superfamily N-acetyltransferase